MLKDALLGAFGAEALREDGLHPAGVHCFGLPPERFDGAAGVMKKNYALLAAEWASDETPFGRGFCVYACYRWGSEYLIVKAALPPGEVRFPSLSRHYLPAVRFERQIGSLMGLVSVGNRDGRPWIRFEDWPSEAWPLRKGFDAAKPLERTDGTYDWVRAEGEGVYEIPVGPVHAGIIEPGHFRFQALGEDVLNMEARLGYVHKGIEKKFEALSWKDGIRLAARVSGDTTVAHSIAYAIALESLTGCCVPERAHWLRALFLERERIANHLGDIGAICNDAAFSFMLYQLARLREVIAGTNRKLFGHRFIMDRVIPGGVSADIGVEGKREILAEMDMLSGEFERLVTIYDEHASLEDRLRDTGILRPEQARELCVVGIAARASGLNLDCRIFNPFPPYNQHHYLELDVPVLIAGDVHARVWVRVQEVRESIRIIRKFLEDMPEGPIAASFAEPMPDQCGFGAVEGWRGEIIYWLQSGPDGAVNRCMVRDPSAVNWLALERAVPGNIVPDFPLCNKSFNQSYSGHDL